MIKIIKNKKEIEAIEKTIEARGANTEIMSKAGELEIGEVLILEKDEWKGKLTPRTIQAYTYANKRRNFAQSKLGKSWVGKKFSVREMENGKWFIKRVK